MTTNNLPPGCTQADCDGPDPPTLEDVPYEDVAIVDDDTLLCQTCLDDYFDGMPPYKAERCINLLKWTYERCTRCIADAS